MTEPKGMSSPSRGAHGRGRCTALCTRLMDIIFSGAGLLLGMPLFLLLAIFTGMDGGSPLFIQVRVGQDGRHFSLIKFRTMRVGTKSLPTHMVDPASFTWIGGLLRRSKLDELPQLWNVLKGEMSLVGPRPSLPSQTDVIEARASAGVTAARPGVTGLAQLQGVDMSNPRALAELDAKMMRDLSVSRYLVLLFRTAIGRGSGDRIGRTDDKDPRGP